MPQQPKVIHTAKRKINASEQSMQDLIAQIAQYNEEMESLSIEKEKAMGGTEDEEEALTNAFRKYSATAKTNTTALEVLRQAESKAIAELQELAQELARATEKSKAATKQRVDFEEAHARQMNIHKDNVRNFEQLQNKKQSTKTN